MADTRFPHLYMAMQQAALLVQQRWQETAEQMLTTPGERESYSAGLTTGPVVETGESLHTTVSNTAPQARRIEEGWAAYHLPDRINWGEVGTRSEKTGRYYLIVPFRHYSAQRASRLAQASPAARRNMLTRAVYTIARQLQPGQYITAGPTAGRAVHAPGLRAYVPAFPPNIRPGYTHAALQERLRRVPGARKGASQYVTFRTMTEQSAGWWIPGKAGRSIAATTVRQVTPEVVRLLTDAARQDVTTLITVTVGQMQQSSGQGGG